MPIYGYRCSQCGHELEVFQSMSAEPLRVCPECSGSLRKLLYPVGVQFKGSGFYTTDYKNNGGGSGSSSSSKSDSSSKTESAAPSNGSKSSDSNGGGSSDGKAASTSTSKE